MLATFLVMAATFGASASDGVSVVDDIRRDFADPPFCYKSRPLWFWNAPLNDDTTAAIMKGSKEMGYCGFGILPMEGTPKFMGPEYLHGYGVALDTAAALGMKMCLYDEYWFPSGSAGGQLKAQYPEALGKRLDKSETEVTGPKPLSQTVPKGQLMATVAMNTKTLERVDLSDRVHDGTLIWNVPEGKWKVMMFACVPDGARDIVDYLSPEAVEKFIGLTYQKYYGAFPDHFGTVIDSAFYDEPTMHWVEGGRAWTGTFNEKFKERYGGSPATYYPALWYDIGDETASARNAMFGMRAELYSAGFPKTVNDWCRAHGVQLTGHMDQEEIVNPVGLCGDLIKSFEYQDIPGVDEIFVYGRGSKAYKVISSAAYNYDRPLVMSETYGGMKAMPVPVLYKEAMDLFAKGINMMIPHAVWYNEKKIVFEPELSHRTEPYASVLPEYNKYVGRLQRVLQQGRHVADIAVLYPIATLQAGYYFGPGKPYEGGVIPEETDYMDVGELLALNVRRDFTFIHPEVLEAKCSVDGPRIKLNNKNNPEEYRVFIMPGAITINAGSLSIIKRFYELGGKVIATTQLPYKSAELGKDAEVRQMVKDIFGVDTVGKSSDKSETRNENAAGGKAFFMGKPTVDPLCDILNECLPVPDVRLDTKPSLPQGNLTYIHKVIGERDVYFFANSSETSIDTPLRLRGKLSLESWDPHTGEMRACDVSNTTENGEEVTATQLKLSPVHSVFFVSKKR